MKAYRKVLVVLVLGLVGFSLVYLSAQLRVVEGSNHGVNKVLSASEIPPKNNDTESTPEFLETAAAATTRRTRQINVSSMQTSYIRRQQNRYPVSLNSSRRSSLPLKNRFRPSPSIEQVLEYVHITKTGGTAVERAGGEAGLQWGICHFRFHIGYGLGCRRPNWGKKFSMRTDIPIANFSGELWHTPPSWFRNNPYEGTPTFTIVRNPYDRIISEFYCPYFGYYRDQVRPIFRKSSRTIAKFKPRPVQDVERYGAANNLRQNMKRPAESQVVEYSNTTRIEIEFMGHSLVRKPKKKGKRPLPPANVLNFNHWMRRAIKGINPSTGHMLPQFYYVYNDVNSTLHKVVNHVLRYENIHQGFVNLMRQYGLERVKLSRYKPEPRDHTGRRRFTVADLQPRTICLINQHYAQDFDLFGYTKSELCANFDGNEDVDSDPDPELESLSNNLTISRRLGSIGHRQ